ncbi:MAG: hypothetical protein ACOCTG_00180 [Bacteroidota bacterium]
MLLTADRLLVLAIGVTLLAADGYRRLRKQRREGELEDRPYRIFLAVLVVGTLLTWAGFVSVSFNG